MIKEDKIFEYYWNIFCSFPLHVYVSVPHSPFLYEACAEDRFWIPINSVTYEV
jgi:hypothetical protein